MVMSEPYGFIPPSSESRTACSLHVSSCCRYDHSLPCAESSFNAKIWLSVLALNGQKSPTLASTLERAVYVKPQLKVSVILLVQEPNHL